MTDKDFYMNAEKAKKLAVDALEMAQAAIKQSSADETEVVVSASDFSAHALRQQPNTPKQL